MRPELLFQAAFALATAIFYAWIGRLILRRAPSPDAKAANALFATWWLSLSLLYVLSAVLHVAAALDRLDVPLAVAWIHTVLVLLCVALWALVGFLVYLYTGSRRWFWPLGAGYAVLAFLLLWLMAWLDPTGIRPGGLTLQLEYANEAPAWLSLMLGLAVSGPIVLAALAYGSLYFRVKERAPRYRIAMVAGAFLFWFGWSIVSAVLRLSARYPDSLPLYAWQQAMAVLVPVVVVMAYRPPRWVRARLREPTTDA